jgi:AcrR family transcriptional regulator
MRKARGGVALLPHPVPARLTREQAAASQRGRLLRAMAEAVADAGYAQTTVGDVIARAGVSRRTFYEHFTGKQDCFLAAFDLGASVLFDAVSEAADPGQPTWRQVRSALHVYLTLLAGEPEFAKAALIEVYAAGPEAIIRRQRLFDRFVELFRGMYAGSVREPESLPARSADLELVIGAISFAVTMRVSAGEAEALPGLCDRLTSFVLTSLRDAGYGAGHWPPTGPASS